MTDINSHVPCMKFFGLLKWLDGRPLLDTIEDYRRSLFERALDSHQFNLVLSGRAKKNWKTTDLILAALYLLLVPQTMQGNDALILANDEDQAADDLSLAKKLVQVNSLIASEVEILLKEIRRRDNRGSLKILPAKDIVGAHGKTAAFVGFDEIHGYKNWDLIEALTPDPTRRVLIWITTYDTIWNSVGIPLFDLKALGRAGTDPKMLFSWYSADLCTDPAFVDLEPELRANPSIASWPEGMAYLEQQKRRLPTHKYRRLHLNLPGAPNNAFFDQGSVLAAIAPGRTVLPPEGDIKYRAFVDMSGGSSDDSVLAIAHEVGERKVVIDLVEKQAGGVPFSPRSAVSKFANILKQYHCAKVIGDNYAGRTFVSDFQGHSIEYQPCLRPKTDLYEFLEPLLNAGEIELPDLPKLQEQLLTLVVRGARVDHEPGGHDDYANAAAGAAWVIKHWMRRFEPQLVGCPVNFDLETGKQITTHDVGATVGWISTSGSRSPQVDQIHHGGRVGWHNRLDADW
jgi:hypothetical protein